VGDTADDGDEPLGVGETALGPTGDAVDDALDVDGALGPLLHAVSASSADAATTAAPVRDMPSPRRCGRPSV
jgi:hypothetical protein